MPTLNLVITDAGRAAIVNAQNTGTLPVVISQVALGTGRWSPTAEATALQAELKRTAAVGGDAVAPDTIHVTVTDSSSDAYALGEFGLVTDTGVLFAIYSDPDGITDKAADALLLIAADCVLTSVPPESVTVGAPGFINPPATETVAGVAELATQAEAEGGADDARIVTPKKAKAAAAAYTYIADQDLASPSNTGTIAQLVSWITGRIRAITGESDWKAAPATTLEAAASHMTTASAHMSNTSNPHGVTKSQVGLGSVQNYGVATQAEAEAGTADNKYMTPLKAKQGVAVYTFTANQALSSPADTGTISQLVSWITGRIRAITGESDWKAAPATTLEAAASHMTAASGHMSSTNNPHGVTKSQVGLGSVANYGIATQAEAEAGTANNKYMTPLRVAQAMHVAGYDKFPSGTRLVFQQSSAPVGWTKVTDHNNKALRVVSGSASSGGSMDFTAAFASGRAASSVTVTGTVLGSSLSADQLASHQHESPYAANDTRYVQTSNGYVVFPGTERALGSSSSGYSNRKRYRTDSRGGGNPHDHPFSANAHSHTMDMNVKYVDVIIASKN